MTKVILFIFWFLCFPFFTNISQTLDVIPKEAKEGEVNFNGFYSSCTIIDENCNCMDGKDYFSHQLIFFEDGRICEIIGKMTDVYQSYMNIIENKYNLYSWGTYSIYGERICATINSLYFVRGQRWKHIKTHYEGVLLSKGCIANWKVVTPYPNFFYKKLSKELNGDFEYVLTDEFFTYTHYPKVSLLKELIQSKK
ncbi:MAG TPA: hypothetical protein PKX92_14185 [Edaphocola sp.]|nr:hypothetical protein [Edaphocola sp.]